MQSGASFDAPSGAPLVPTGGLPGNVGAPVDSAGLSITGIQLLIEAWNQNTAQLSALLNAVIGPVTGDLTGTLTAGGLTVTGIENKTVVPAAWTPADGSGAGLTFTSVSAGYTRLGNMVFAYATVIYPTTADGTNAVITGLPFAAPNVAYAVTPAIVLPNGGTTAMALVPVPNSITAKLVNSATGAPLTNANVSTLTLSFLLIYPAS